MGKNFFGFSRSRVGSTVFGRGVDESDLPKACQHTNLASSERNHTQTSYTPEHPLDKVEPGEVKPPYQAKGSE